MCANLKRFARAAQARRLPPSDLAARVIRFDSEGYVSSRMKRDVAMAEAPNRRRSAAAERAGSSSFLARPGLGHRDCVAGSVSYEAHSLTHAQYQSRARSLVTVQLTVHRGARGQAWLRLLARRMKPVKLILILNYWPRRATATAARTAGQGVTVDGRRRP